MSKFSASPIDFFNRWLVDPIQVTVPSVSGIMDALEDYPFGSDARSPFYFMPRSRRREEGRRYRIFGEVQDLWYCFVYEHAAGDRNPPVYFESCLAMADFGIPETDTFDGDHVLIADTFENFLWHMLGSKLCLRERPDVQMRPGVCGVQFDFTNPAQLGPSWINPLSREFPTLYTCFFDGNAFCIEEWGAVFRDVATRNRFKELHSEKVVCEWP